MGKWKLIVGGEHQASWYGHFTPNATDGHTKPSTNFVDCDDPAYPCLYDLDNDPTEHNNLNPKSGPGIPVDPVAADALESLLLRFKQLEVEYHPKPNPSRQSSMYCAHLDETQHFVSPWYTPPPVAAAISD